MPTKMLPTVWPPPDSPLPVTVAEVYEAMEALRLGGMRGTQGHDAYIMDARMCGPWLQEALLWTRESWREVPTWRAARPVQAPIALPAAPGLSAQEATPGPPPPPLQQATTVETTPPVQMAHPSDPHLDALQDSSPEAPLPTAQPGELYDEGAPDNGAPKVPPGEPGSAPNLDQSPLATSSGDGTATVEDPPKEVGQALDSPTPAMETPQETPPSSQGEFPEKAASPPAPPTQGESSHRAQESPGDLAEHAMPPARAQDSEQAQSTAPDSPGDQEEAAVPDHLALGTLD
jgi:hypothetical protein